MHRLSVSQEIRELETLPVALSFQKDWEKEFLEAHYHPSILICCCWIGSLHLAVDGMKAVFGSLDRADGPFIWKLLTWSPYFLCSCISLCIAIIYSSKSPQFRKICILYYDHTCVLCLSMWFFAFAAAQAGTEVRRSIFQYQATTHIQWKIDFVGTLPSRACHDSNTSRTWLDGELSLQNVGCNNLVLGGGSVCTYLLDTLMPPIYNMHPSAALLSTAIHVAILLAAAFAGGTSDSPALFSAVSLIGFAGLSSAYLCAARRAEARSLYAASKHIRELSSRNRRLLCSFIPLDVLTRLEAQPPGASGELVGADVDPALVLFCTLEPRQSLRAEPPAPLLRELDRVFADFDAVVARSGLFKYQHVGEWYIVACPRAAAPFDAVAQAAPAAGAHVAAMLDLASELRRIAAGHALPGCGLPLRLRAGVASGPVAGVVIGAQRRFYCLYGNTVCVSVRPSVCFCLRACVRACLRVHSHALAQLCRPQVNMAARMCKLAGDDAVRADAAFAALLRAADPAAHRARCRSAGFAHVKGAGTLETFDIADPSCGVEDWSESLSIYPSVCLSVCLSCLCMHYLCMYRYMYIPSLCRCLPGKFHTWATAPENMPHHACACVRTRTQLMKPY